MSWYTCKNQGAAVPPNPTNSGVPEFMILEISFFTSWPSLPRPEKRPTFQEIGASLYYFIEKEKRKLKWMQELVISWVFISIIGSLYDTLTLYFEYMVMIVYYIGQGHSIRFSFGPHFKTNNLHLAAHLDLPVKCHGLVGRAAELDWGGWREHGNRNDIARQCILYINFETENGFLRACPRKTFIITLSATSEMPFAR